MAPETAPTVDDGAGQPPWLPTLARLFIAGALLLTLPRQWIAAGVSMTTGLVLAWIAQRRRAGA